MRPFFRVLKNRNACDLFWGHGRDVEGIDVSGLRLRPWLGVLCGLRAGGLGVSASREAGTCASTRWIILSVHALRSISAISNPSSPSMFA